MQVADLETRLIHAKARSGTAQWMLRHRRWLVAAAVLAVALLGFAALRGLLAEVRLKEVRAALHAIPDGSIGLALALTVGSYLCLTLYDVLALRAIGRPLPWRTAALASFTSYTVSHNLGLSLLTGGSARYRVYAAAGLELGDVARVTLLASATFWGGVAVVGAAALFFAATPIELGIVTIAPLAGHLAGAALLGGVVLLFAMRASGRKRIGWGDFVLPVPSLPILSAQIGVAALDLLLAATTLYVLLPAASAPPLDLFLVAYAVGLVAILVTHVPGGIGVFEAVMLATVPGDRPGLFAALLLYRVIYYLLPLATAAGLLGVLEGRRLRHPIAVGVSMVEQASRALAPPLLAALVFTGGLVLLVSGALPAARDRIFWLADVLPLPFIEASHFSASLAGTVLIMVSPAINARLRSGFIAARLLLVGGAVFSILKGVDYEEAAILTVIAGILQYCRPAFYRRAGVFDAPFQRLWLAAAMVALALSLWAGFFAYKRVPYSTDLWWEFAWRGNAPRFLRASVGAVVVLVAVAAWRLLAAPVRAHGESVLAREIADRAFAVSSRADAALAYTGDKHFIVSASADAFLMYRVQGRTWVVMGDPVGPVAAWSELVWRIRAECDAAHGRLCFYQASTDMLPLLVELGLQTMKYGEEAHVPLDPFSLDGPAGKSLRHSVRRAEAAGLRFEILPVANVAAYGPALKEVSDAWLRGKAGAEKRFSIGRFDPDYLVRFDCAVLWQEDRIIAFANIWATRNRHELSVDLMRHFPDTPYGTMDLLLVRLMQWGEAEGYRRFNLGMAPLSGLGGGRLAPGWSRIGHAIYGHGEALYGFAGLRSFKAKFHPDWQPRYVATPPGLPAARAMIDLIALIGG
ncbi:MAG: bifunctional lysylphosphatidylglycerol flippase/synthetase MprF [Pseudomonadota bacterium]